MSEREVRSPSDRSPSDRSPSDVDRRQHLATLHSAWATPLNVVAAVVGEVTKAPIVDSRRIVEGEQNEVYDVTLDQAPSVIVRISHTGSEAHDREAWVLGQCAVRGIRAPRVHAVRRVEVCSEFRSVMVTEKLPGVRLADLDPDDVDVRRVLEEVGAWLKQLHTIPVRGLGNLDGSGVGTFETLDEWLANVTTQARLFEDAGRSVGLEPTTIRGWLREILDSLRGASPRMTMSHNDLLAVHVLVHDGRLSGIIDFGVAAAEPAANDFAKWSFREGARFPVEWIQAGYGDPGLFEPPNDRSYRALWLLHGLWYLRHYYVTGFPAGVRAGRDRLLSRPGR
ncbi:aminoglycoside phosphotransferase family protein [Microlunatus elymi]|uniref:Aminoglycoside phosphotransferase family protein n=1 Tax=Microlunatus elymi TaxID=2596828 RepID=A0A516PWC7_9ACTN|nr:aminoglycoside phosphotransferase family protein [Microlunatus elymi]QDP95483.1 aminoglycoside phosphotransferase family protein [Microlunatus elymi]